MEYYSPEYFLEPTEAIILHKPVLPSITNISYHDIVQVSVAPSKQPPLGQMCTSSSATTMKQDSVHILPSPINTSEQCPTPMLSPGIEQQVSNEANNTLATDKPQFIQPEPSLVASAHLSLSTPPEPSVVTNTPLSKPVLSTKKKLSLKRHVEHTSKPPPVANTRGKLQDITNQSPLVESTNITRTMPTNISQFIANTCSLPEEEKRVVRSIHHSQESVSVPKPVATNLEATIARNISSREDTTPVKIKTLSPSNTEQLFLIQPHGDTALPRGECHSPMPPCQECPPHPHFQKEVYYPVSHSQFQEGKITQVYSLREDVFCLHKHKETFLTHC